MRRQMQPYRPTWYRVENRADNKASVYIMDYIGEFGVSASDFVKEISELTVSSLEVHVNSPGGNAFDGMAIYNALKNHTANEVVMVVDGLAASAASFIVQAGTKRVMAASSSMMIHEAQGMAAGTAAEMRKTADMLEKISGTITSIYSDRSGKDKDYYAGLMSDETWFTAEEALEAGLIDEIGGVENKAYIPKEGNPLGYKLADVTNMAAEEDNDADLTKSETAAALQAALQRAFN